MKKIIALALAATTVISLSACSAGTQAASDCNRLSKEGDAVNAIKVEGKVFEKPTVTFKGPLTAKETQSKVISGDSKTIVNEHDSVSLDLSLYSSKDGSLITASSYDGANYAKIPLSSDYLGGIQQALTCAPVGGRVVSVIVGDKTLNAALQLGETDSVVAVFDIKDSIVISTKPAAGEQMPTVSEDTDGIPIVTIPKADPPAQTRVVVEKEGSGAVVKASDTVEVNYHGVLWSNGTVFDSSFERGEPAQFPLNGVVAGFKKGLEGQKVGSRVTIVVTPEDGYGSTDQGSIPANSYLVFVVDILSIVKQ